MKIVIIGGTGLIGSKVVRMLTGRGHEAVAASPDTGVNSVTGEGLFEAIDGAAVVVDVSNSPSFGDVEAAEFFITSTSNIISAGRKAGVAHYVALSVVGTDRLQGSGYFRAKLAQETLIKASPIPYTILRATQFFEFVARIADSSTSGYEVRVPTVLMQPMAAEDVARAVANAAVGKPHACTIEVAGPEEFRMDDLVRRVLSRRRDPRPVVTDPDAGYWGIAPLGERALLPAWDATVFEIRLDEWLKQAGAK